MELHPFIILNHEDLVLYKNLLFPHIPLQILKGLKSKHIFYSILKFLQNCCFTVENAFVYISRQDYIINPIEKIGGLLYCSPLLGYIVCEELRTGKSFATLKQIEPLELNGLPVEIKRYKLLKEFLIDEDGKEILKISNNETQRILYFKLSQNKMTEHDKKNYKFLEKIMTRIIS